MLRISTLKIIICPFHLRIGTDAKKLTSEQVKQAVEELCTRKTVLEKGHAPKTGYTANKRKLLHEKTKIAAMQA